MCLTYCESALGPIIAQAKNLKALHVTYAYDILADAPRTRIRTRTNPLETATPSSEHSSGDDSQDGSEGSEDEDDLEGLGSLFGNDALVETETERSADAVFDARHPLPSMEELESLAAYFPDSVRQFGVQTRVWQVRFASARPSPPAFFSLKGYSCEVSD